MDSELPFRFGFSECFSYYSKSILQISSRILPEKFDEQETFVSS